MCWFDQVKILTQAQGFTLSQTKAQVSFTTTRPAQSQSSGHQFFQEIKLENRSDLKLIAERKKGLKVSFKSNQSSFHIHKCLPAPAWWLGMIPWDGERTSCCSWQQHCSKALTKLCLTRLNLYSMYCYNE